MTEGLKRRPEGSCVYHGGTPVLACPLLLCVLTWHIFSETDFAVTSSLLPSLITPALRYEVICAFFCSSSPPVTISFSICSLHSTMSPYGQSGCHLSLCPQCLVQSLAPVLWKGPNTAQAALRILTQLRGERALTLHLVQSPPFTNEDTESQTDHSRSYT